MQQWWGRDVRNTGGDKYETTAREIQNGRFSTFCSKWRMTFRKVTPAALKVNVKKFWQVLLVPWHVWAPIWVHFAPWWSIFPVKNRFSHIFPVPGGLPFLTVILTVKLARLLLTSQTPTSASSSANPMTGARSCLQLHSFIKKKRLHQSGKLMPNRNTMGAFHTCSHDFEIASKCRKCNSLLLKISLISIYLFSQYFGIFVDIFFFLARLSHTICNIKQLAFLIFQIEALIASTGGEDYHWIAVS